MPVVTTTPSQVADGGTRVVVQNPAGSGANLAVSLSANPATAAGGNGILIADGQAYEWPGSLPSPLYAVSDVADTDVRVERL